ncbi:MAG: hypothetical protein IJS41_06025 [Clostridia bacterium]|nr:hypothetical protein [Clostridia bacterium]
MTLNDLARKYGLNSEEKQIFKAYCANRFDEAGESEAPDTSFLKVWERIIDYAEMFGAVQAVNHMICPGRPVTLASPETLEIRMYDSPAGRIPILYVRDTADFEQLATNIAFKGIRPEHLSETGAFFLSNKTTRFIILSAKPYSNVPAKELGLPDEAAWEEQSLILRRGHECTHYFTKQTYGITNNMLHDEIMADFVGMYEAFGFYKAEWFLRFMGVIPGSGGRLIFYTKDLPENARRAVSRLAERIAYGLEKWSHTDSFRAMTTAERIKWMCRTGLEGMLEN